ncbi:MAG: hypothetical protein ACYTJ0_14350, partial [Planctomycetota bacterium]
VAARRDRNGTGVGSADTSGTVALRHDRPPVSPQDAGVACAVLYAGRMARMKTRNNPAASVGT